MSYLRVATHGNDKRNTLNSIKLMVASPGSDKKCSHSALKNVKLKIALVGHVTRYDLSNLSFSIMYCYKIDPKASFVLFKMLTKLYHNPQLFGKGM